MRNALTNCNDYKCAFDMLVKTSATGSCYLIIAEVFENEGTVITRNINGADGINTL